MEQEQKESSSRALNSDLNREKEQNQESGSEVKLSRETVNCKSKTKIEILKTSIGLSKNGFKREG